MRTRNAIKAAPEMSADDIVRRLEEEIALGLLRPRERLVEEELMLRFNSKRHVIRQVLVDLDLLGIVERPPNRGAMVRDIGAQEIDQIYFMRELLERTAIEVMRLPADAAVIKTLTGLHQQHCKAVKESRLREVFRLNLEFHQVLFGACGNAQLAEAISQFAFKAHAIRSYTIAHPTLLARVRVEHARMIELMRGTNRRALIRLVSAHIKPAKDAYLQASRQMARLDAPPR